ncbi:MAG: SDR family oxidoreductase [Gemmatimonadetes bacterium]|nr:SDR family oxidoreductase [Gemmatimonadota bacterium]
MSRRQPEASASEGRARREDQLVAEPQVHRAVEQLLDEVKGDPKTQPLRLLDDLRGKGAIVTGGSTGIGRAIALGCACNGVHVAFNYLDDGSGTARSEAEETARELRELEVKVVCRPCDVRDAAAVGAFVEEAVQVIGGLHILVNNAGTADDSALWRMTDEQWANVLDTNLTGAFHFIRAVAPHFRRQEYGKIVNVSSVHAVRGDFGISNYTASKAGLLGLTRSAAIELGPSNVNVNAVAPGYIRTTHLTEMVPQDVLDRARERSALQRLGGPQDVANVVLFLCTEAARHLTGVVIPVDGGYLI